jgi:nucleoid-associated protein YgaU
MVPLQHAEFQRLKVDGGPDGAPLPVQFNPTEFTLTKNAQIAEIAIPGLDSPILQFVRGQTETLSLDLFFDSTDQGTGADAHSVTEVTDKFYELVKIDSHKHAPPILILSWGGSFFPGNRFNPQLSNQHRYGFKCIVDSVRQRFTFFSPEGKPLRATLTVSLREYKTLADQVRELNLGSADQSKSHVVTQGDTLARIAWDAYGDSAEWRRIANANNLVDPLDIRPGAVLQIPPAD